MSQNQAKIYGQKHKYDPIFSSQNEDSGSKRWPRHCTVKTLIPVQITITSSVVTHPLTSKQKFQFFRLSGKVVFRYLLQPFPSENQKYVFLITHLKVPYQYLKKTERVVPFS